MKKVIKIGRNRGKARLWLEGKALQQAGWNPAEHYDLHYGEDGIYLTKITAHLDEWINSRKVSNKKGLPVLDINTDKILEVAGDHTHMEVTVDENSIVFKPCNKPDSKFKQAVKAALVVAGAITLPFINTMRPDAKKILVACEESGRVRDSFNMLGHEAVSCDLMESESPEGWHIRDDVRNHLDKDWDMVIAFIPCTYLTNSAAWAFKDPDYDKYPGVGYHQKIKEGTLTGEARRLARAESVEFAEEIWESAEQVCIENPRGSLSTMFRKPTQIIQPHEYGQPHSKATCLWLKNLPKLIPTMPLDIEEHGWLAPNGKYRWKNQTASGQSNLPPTPDRAILRSKTYHGVAAAMALYWG